ncbi:MAG: hypothetical protein GY705_03530 [Bacteroidetes bacterium]|nr:hypothetical protein [Bacteroidota bacterium]
MRISISILMILLMVGISCQKSARNVESEKEKADMGTLLSGVWESVSLNVEINSYLNEDTSFVFDVPEEKWISILGILPQKTYFEKDSTYRVEYIDKTGAIYQVTHGKWLVNEDTLFLNEPSLNYQYLVTYSDGLIEYRSTLDWDGDGQEDDKYLGVHRRISRTTF